MLYEKPKDIRYVDMCKYIDENVYTEQGVDDETLFTYLYHIFLMLARTQHFFNRTDYYDDYAIFTATVMFFRYRNPKQFELDENGKPKLSKVKGVLNYCRRISYPYKVQFEQQFYSQVYSKEPEQDENVQMSEYLFSDMIADDAGDITRMEFDTCLGDMINTGKAFLKKIPYRTDPAMWNNIYLSCMLTFLNSITLSNKDKERLNNLQNLTDDKLDRTYVKNNTNSVILYHLPDSYYNYIDVLTKELKHAIAYDLSYSLQTYIPAESGMRQVVLHELAGTSAGETEKDG